MPPDDTRMREALWASRDPASFGPDIRAAARQTIDQDLRRNRWVARTGRTLRAGAGDVARWMRRAFSRGRTGQTVPGAPAASPGREAPGVSSGRKTFERMVRLMRAVRNLVRWLRRRASQPADVHGAGQPAPELWFPQPLAQRIMNRPVPGERYMRSLPPELGRRAAIAQAIELTIRQDPKLAALHADGRMTGAAQFLAAVDRDIDRHTSATPPLPAQDPQRVSMWGDEVRRGIARASAAPAGDPATAGPADGVQAQAARMRTARPDGVARSPSNPSAASAAVRRSSSSANTPRR
ncbi:hypothetical protein [Krasilnikovia sp. MM14-A1259]|uniref:hypothetical protein n=1 Tax=Krasilnikovia sp. MM14-A1259 TaxID=3373539 RepID=UPI003817930F